MNNAQVKTSKRNCRGYFFFVYKNFFVKANHTQNDFFSFVSISFYRRMSFYTVETKTTFKPIQTR